MQTKNGSETIDIQFLLRLILKNWFYFAFCIALAIGMAIVYIRFSTKLFAVSTKILIRDKNNVTNRSKTFIEGMELFNESQNLQNEIAILSSANIISNTVRQLGLNISYYSRGDFNTVERYNDNPFKVYLDTSHVQLYNIPIYVEVLSNKKYRIYAEGKDVYQYDVRNDRVINKKVNVKFNKELYFGEYLNDNNLGLWIFPNEGAWIDKTEKTYFVINTYRTVSKAYEKKLVVTPYHKDASVVEVYVEGPVAEKEIDFLNKLSEVYLNKGLEEKNSIAQNTIKFIDNQLQLVSDSLHFAEGKLEDFRRDRQVMDINYSSNYAFANLQKLDEERAQLVVKSKYYFYLYEYLKKNNDVKEMVAPSSMGVDDPLLNDLIRELSLLYQERNTLAYTTTPNNPQLEVLDVKINSSKSKLLENLRNIIKGSEIVVNDINKRKASLETEISKLPETERMLVDIQRKFKLNDEIFNYLLQKRAEAGIAKASNTSDNKIIDRAEMKEDFPVAPKKMLVYLMAVVIGFMIPFSILLLRYFLNKKVIRIEEIQKASVVPILSAIPHTKKKLFESIHETDHMVSEAFGSAKINLQYYFKGPDKKIISVTSPSEGDGKTFTTLHLAKSLAESGKRILVIGMELNDPSFLTQFNLQNDLGLVAYLNELCGEDEIIQKSNIANLEFISFGNVDKKLSTILDSPRLGKLLYVLRERYNYIIIDSPVATLFSGYYILTNYTDINIFVLREKHSDKESIKAINKLNESGRVKGLSILYNDTTFKTGLKNPFTKFKESKENKTKNKKKDKIPV
jgi:capsular exopolysaccharide synthesis family protein